MIKIIFMGTPDYATEIFKSLINDKDFELIALFTQPDKPVGRKQIITPPHIKQYCIDNAIDIKIYQPTTLKDEAIIQAIQELKPDFIVVAAYGQILPQSILSLAPCINLHASLLPKYRGASPIQDAIKNIDKYTGVTSMLMEKGLDTGDILGLSYVKVENKKVDELFYELSQVASLLTIKTIKNFDSIKPLKQNSSLATYSKKIQKEDGLISFDNAKDICAKFRAYCFWPDIFLSSELKIKNMELIDDNGNYNAGEILHIDKEYVIIGCNIGKVKISTVQPASKKEMNVVDYLRGRRIGIGDTIL